MIYTIVRAGAIRARAIGAGAASRYGSGSGSDQMMRLLAAPQQWVKDCYILYHLQFLTMFNTIVRAGSAGAGAASRYGSSSSSNQMMWLLAALAPTLQHWFLQHHAGPRLQMVSVQLIDAHQVQKV
jgi:hypothetical protein